MGFSREAVGPKGDWWFDNNGARVGPMFPAPSVQGWMTGRMVEDLCVTLGIDPLSFFLRVQDEQRAARPTASD